MLKLLDSGFPRFAEYKYCDMQYSFDAAMKEKGWALIAIYQNERTETISFLIGRDELSSELYGDK